MKRTFSIFMLAVLLVSAFGFSASPASAAELITYVEGRFVWGKGVVFVFDASGYRNKDVRGADIFVGSNFHDFGCTVNAERTQIICVANGGLTRYAGQTGIIYLAGQIFYVTIPNVSTPQAADGPLVCEEPLSAGAYVEFELWNGNTTTEFVPGDTLQEVQDRADLWVDGEFWVSHGPVGSLECGLAPQ